MTLDAVNRYLEKECLGNIKGLEWSLWADYYVSIVKNDPILEDELINNNRSLPWFAKELNRRKQKQIIS